MAHRIVRSNQWLWGVLGVLLGASVATARPVSALTAMTQGVPGKGPHLLAVFQTDKGDITCRLHPDAAPTTVANFSGLASGNKPFVDPKTKRRRKGRFYDGLTFHRVIPGFLIQGGDPTGAGRGGPGFVIPDEPGGLRHDQAGRLSMAHLGPGTAGSQFFITLQPTPWLDGRYTAFGTCRNLDVLRRLAAVPVVPPNRPKDPLRLRQVRLKWGQF